MALQEMLMSMGYVPKGVQPNVVTESGGAPHSGTLSRSGNVLTKIVELQQQQQKQVKEQQEEQKRKVDFYNTLRTAGYDPKTAYEAVESGNIPSAAPAEDTVEVQEKQSKIERSKAETELIKKRTETLGTTKAALTDRIINKVANDEPLSVGEQNVYDNVIKRAVSGDELVKILEARKTSAAGDKAGSNAALDQNNTVPLIDPQGKRKRVHKDDVQKALKKGWKKPVQ